MPRSQTINLHEGKKAFCSKRLCPEIMLVYCLVFLLKRLPHRAVKKAMKLWFDVHIKLAPKIWDPNNVKVSYATKNPPFLLLGKLHTGFPSTACALRSSQWVVHMKCGCGSGQTLCFTFSSSWTLLRGPRQLRGLKWSYLWQRFKSSMHSIYIFLGIVLDRY